MNEVLISGFVFGQKHLVVALSIRLFRHRRSRDVEFTADDWLDALTLRSRVELRNTEEITVVGDGEGQVGAGLGKALVIPDAVRKGNAVARRNMIKIPLKGGTIPQQITLKKGATIVIIKPAREGTGVIAAAAMRAILELGGVKDVVGKTLGSRNPINIVYATLAALGELRDPETERARRLSLRTAHTRQ